MAYLVIINGDIHDFGYGDEEVAKKAVAELRASNGSDENVIKYHMVEDQNDLWVITPELAVSKFGYKGALAVYSNLADWYDAEILGWEHKINRLTIRYARLRERCEYYMERIREGDLIENDNYVDEDFHVGERNGFNYDKPNKPGEKFYNKV